MTTAVIPTGTLKQLKLSEITVGERFRKDFSNDESFVESIREKGVLQPITVDKSLVLLAGERRYRAAQALGLEKIPALVRPIEGEIDAREIELIENTFRKEFTWQERARLTAEIDRLYKDKDFTWSGRKTAELLSKGIMTVARDIEMAHAMDAIPELATQATASDAYKMLKRFEENIVIDELSNRLRERHDLDNSEFQDIDLDGTQSVDESDEPIEARSPNYKNKPFTAVQQANFDYKIGNVFKGLKAFPSDGVIHLIECDPPYGIDLTAVKAGKESVTSTVHGYEEVAAEKYVGFLTQLATELYRVAGKDCWLVFWYGPTWHTEVKAALTIANWHVDDIPAIWVKGAGQTLQPEVYLARTYEPFFLCRKGQPYMAVRGRANVFQYSGVQGAAKYHPTERPLDLIKDILSTLGVAQQTVLVPFLGSGATLRACYKLGMRGYGWDLNDQYKQRFLLNVEEDSKLAEQLTKETT